MQTFKVALIATSALAGGFAAGYFVARKKFENELSEALDREVQATKEFYKRLYKAEEFSTPESALETVEDIVEEEQYNTTSRVFDRDDLDSPEDEEGEEEDEVEDEVEDSQIVEELPDRDPEYPYVITQAEWDADDPAWASYERLQVTYYEGDNTLADDQDSIVKDLDGILGESNMNLFGKGFADDPNTLYIRNENIEVEFEVVRDPGTYSETILGIPDEHLTPKVARRSRRDERDD